MCLGEVPRRKEFILCTRAADLHSLHSLEQQHCTDMNCPPCASASSSAPHSSIRLREVWHELVVHIFEEDLAGEVVASLLVTGGRDQARRQKARWRRRDEAWSCLEQCSWVGAWRQQVAKVNILINLRNVSQPMQEKKSKRPGWQVAASFLLCLLLVVHLLFQNL